ncbi:hypothetical protein N658DRAFT_74445 [Parathielavia hyrcaniae]|uniref:BZIP transcription factor n=1 Tax=Parathielavia hyrcaniae TaxID=113614 RepID=A0AAN6SWS9_9PEZI|nr:hypothetical protein N658DRAFT_74445 [Parathielavia hyrcaniae]
MSPHPAHEDMHKPSRGKGKGARRVSNLSEEQRNKKRENDRIAQQNIRRRNKELIEKLQHEVECLRNLERVDMVNQLLQRNHELEDRVRFLEKALSQRAGRSFPPPSGYDAHEMPRCRHPGGYNVPHSFGSPYLAGAANPYDHWPSSVVPVPSAVTVNSVESSPGASGQGEDYTHTPAYVHTSVSLVDGPAAMGGSTSAPSLGAAKTEYRDADAGSSSNGYSSHGVQQSSPAYLHDSPWPAYPASHYYSQATPI